MREVRYEVLLTEGAEQDLESIYDYIAEYDCLANANYVLDRLLKVTALSGDRTQGLHLSYCRRSPRHADLACAQTVGCVIGHFRNDLAADPKHLVPVALCSR